MTRLLFGSYGLISTIEFAGRSDSFWLGICYQHHKAIIALLVTQKSY